MLEIWTARISTRDPDAFNVTKKSGDPVFAPSWTTLDYMLNIRRSGRNATEAEWLWYAKAYLQEMKHSRRRNARAWAALLARPRVVLTCYCTDPKRCHRTLLGRFLAKLGANFRGELPSEEQDLFELMEGISDG